MSSSILPNLVVKSEEIFAAEQPSIPSPPAWASMIDVPTGVPCSKFNSLADFEVNPEPTGCPGGLTTCPANHNDLSSLFWFVKTFEQ